MVFFLFFLNWDSCTEKKKHVSLLQNCDVVNRVLVGNKDDDPSRKVVVTEDARAFAAQMGIQVGTRRERERGQCWFFLLLLLTDRTFAVV